MMTFLIGNDFLPRLPSFSAESLSRIHNIYMGILPELGGYINEKGALNLQRLGTFMKALSVIDEEDFMFRKGINKSEMINQQTNFRAFKEEKSRDDFRVGPDAK